MSDEEDTEKEHEPTERKLDQARKKGEVPKSTDLITAAGYSGFLLAALAFGATSIAQFGTALMTLLDQADSLSTQVFEGRGAPMTAGILMQMTALAPWFGLPAVAAILAIVAQRSFVVAGDKLIPKLSRISVLSNVKNKFGPDGLFEFAKSTTKLVIIGWVLALFLIARRDQVLGTLHMSPGMVAATLASLLIDFVVIVLILAAMIGGVDYMWQNHAHLRKNRMSRKEIQDETKESEGDPHTKQKRRQRGQDIALNQMMQAVPEADVVIVNPTHYAIALKWDRSSGLAPICVAKGVDDVAARIREVANENGVPIHSDPPTARALFAVVDIDTEIWPEHYKAVAAAIRFAEAMRAKARSRSW